MNSRRGKYKKIHIKLARVIVFVLMITCFIVAISEIEESHASRALNIKAGFYGGPYYDVKSVSYAEMVEMSGPIYTYSGVDSGGFMRLCYAWGVSMPTLVERLGIELPSVNYFHLATDDGYGESITTFSASSLMGERYFYPHMIDLVDPKGSEQQTIDFSKVDGSIMRGAQSVPTMIAVGCSDFSRKEAVDAAKHGYKNYAKGDLKNAYRLVFGQAGLGNMGAANNVQASSRNINAINIQLSGSPNIIVDKNLIRGEEGEIGSIYSIKIKIKLPDSYSYLPDDVIKSLERQVLKNLKLGSYDKSVIKILEEHEGEYIVEIIGKGETDLTFRYSRKEYNGSITIAKGSTTIKGSGDGSGGNNIEPTEPVEPSEPETEPEAPTEPVEPSEPETEPEAPTEPVEPSEPETEPEAPTKPVEPSEPETEPEAPTEPVEPSEPETKPVEPSEPETEPEAPIEPTKPVENEQYIGIDTNKSDTKENDTKKSESGANDSNKANNDLKKPAASLPQTQWISTDSVEPNVNSIDNKGDSMDLWKIGAGAIILFLSGFSGGMISFFRRT